MWPAYPGWKFHHFFSFRDPWVSPLSTNLRHSDAGRLGKPASVCQYQVRCPPRWSDTSLIIKKNCAKRNCWKIFKCLRNWSEEWSNFVVNFSRVISVIVVCYTKFDKTVYEFNKDMRLCLFLILLNNGKFPFLFSRFILSIKRLLDFQLVVGD